MADPSPELLAALRKLVAECIGCSQEQVSDDTVLFDAGDATGIADSLDRVEIAMAIEEEYRCEVPDDDIREHFGTVRSIAVWLVGREAAK